MMDQGVSVETLQLYRGSKLSKLEQHLDQSFLSIVKGVCDTSPDAPAVLNATGDILSYGEMEVQSTRLAQCLLEKLSKKKADITKCDIVVSIALTKTNVIIVPLFFAVLKLGSKMYVAEEKLGISLNMDRIRRVGTDLIVVDANNLDLAETGNGYSILTVDISEILKDVGLHDRIDSALLSQRCAHEGGYYMFSSGTTGKPKCMFLDMSFMSNLARTGHEMMRVNRSSRVLQLSRRNFDAFFFEVVQSVGNGAALVLIDHETARHPSQFEEFVNAFDVTWAVITPGHVELLLHKTTSFKCFESLMLVGEAFSNGLIKRLIRSGVQHIMNAYGPSEAGICVLCADIYDSRVSSESPVNISLGQVCIGTNIRVLRQDSGEDAWKLCSLGEEGELFIANCVDNVYDDEDLNRTKYITMNDPITGSPHCFYRTGDIVAISEKGELAFAGRRDNQVKIFGQLVVTDEVRDQLERISDEKIPNEKVRFHVSVQHNAEGKPSQSGSTRTTRHRLKQQLN